MKRKIKFYDKDIYETEQKITAIAIILISFFLGFVVGIFAMTSEIKVQKEYIEMLEQDQYQQMEEKEVYMRMLEEMEGK